MNLNKPHAAHHEIIRAFQQLEMAFERVRDATHNHLAAVLLYTGHFWRNLLKVVNT